mmetsp:Transcript_19661/g.67737  ORF Transcript_19661/g.67737 Transcript_19661/m.67737 type:complete len:221 (-) Transcript_19661:801-1463(-)
MRAASATEIMTGSSLARTAGVCMPNLPRSSSACAWTSEKKMSVLVTALSKRRARSESLGARRMFLISPSLPASEPWRSIPGGCGSATKSTSKRPLDGHRHACPVLESTSVPSAESGDHRRKWPRAHCTNSRRSMVPLLSTSYVATTRCATSGVVRASPRRRRPRSISRTSMAPEALTSMNWKSARKMPDSVWRTSTAPAATVYLAPKNRATRRRKSGSRP